jgi:hypothetical protein
MAKMEKIIYMVLSATNNVPQEQYKIQIAYNALDAKLDVLNVMKEINLNV